MSDHRHRTRWRLFYACTQHGASVDRRHKRLQPTYRAENMSDGLQSYSVLSIEKQYTIKQMKDRKQSDVANHLNHVDSLHGQIEFQYERYRSVASKYINCYAALFWIQELYLKINGQKMIARAY